MSCTRGRQTIFHFRSRPLITIGKNEGQGYYRRHYSKLQGNSTGNKSERWAPPCPSNLICHQPWRNIILCSYPVLGLGLKICRFQVIPDLTHISLDHCRVFLAILNNVHCRFFTDFNPLEQEWLTAAWQSYRNPSMCCRDDATAPRSISILIQCQTEISCQIVKSRDRTPDKMITAQILKYQKISILLSS